jgi:hypothetical protein
MNRPTPELRVQFTKRADNCVILRCVRRDGSATWQRHEKHGAFFAFHDLRHFAVETTLGFRSGFYGLIADGWNIEDTTGKGARGRLSPSSLLVEQIVGLFERERAGGASPLSAEDFNAQIQVILGTDPKRSRFTDAQLSQARHHTEELHTQWTQIPAGATLDLIFSRPPA